LDLVLNGNYNSSSGSYGDVVSFQCNTGYLRNGNETRYCQTNARWSGRTPTCESTIIIFAFPFTAFVNDLKSFLVVQNFRKALKIGFISFALSSFEKGS